MTDEEMEDLEKLLAGRNHNIEEARARIVVARVPRLIEEVRRLWAAAVVLEEVALQASLLIQKPDNKGCRDALIDALAALGARDSAFRATAKLAALEVGKKR